MGVAHVRIFMKQLPKSGEKAPKTGEYQEVGERGGTPSGTPHTVKKGDKLPPAGKKRRRWKWIGK